MGFDDCQDDARNEGCDCNDPESGDSDDDDDDDDDIPELEKSDPDPDPDSDSDEDLPPLESDGICDLCKKPVCQADRIRLMWTDWHKACFRCYRCDVALNHKNYVWRAGALRCTSCIGVTCGVDVSVGARESAAAPTASAERAVDDLVVVSESEAAPTASAELAVRLEMMNTDPPCGPAIMKRVIPITFHPKATTAPSRDEVTAQDISAYQRVTRACQVMMKTGDQMPSGQLPVMSRFIPYVMQRRNKDKDTDPSETHVHCPCVGELEGRLDNAEAQFVRDQERVYDLTETTRKLMARSSDQVAEAVLHERKCADARIRDLQDSISVQNGLTRATAAEANERARAEMSAMVEREREHKAERESISASHDATVTEYESRLVDVRRHKVDALKRVEELEAKLAHQVEANRDVDAELANVLEDNVSLRAEVVAVTDRAYCEFMARPYDELEARALEEALEGARVESEALADQRELEYKAERDLLIATHDATHDEYESELGVVRSDNAELKQKLEQGILGSVERQLLLRRNKYLESERAALRTDVAEMAEMAEREDKHKAEREADKEKIATLAFHLDTCGAFNGIAMAALHKSKGKLAAARKDNVALKQEVCTTNQRVEELEGKCQDMADATTSLHRAELDGLRIDKAELLQLVKELEGKLAHEIKANRELCSRESKHTAEREADKEEIEKLVIDRDTASGFNDYSMRCLRDSDAKLQAVRRDNAALVKEARATASRERVDLRVTSLEGRLARQGEVSRRVEAERVKVCAENINLRTEVAAMVERECEHEREREAELHGLDYWRARSQSAETLAYKAKATAEFAAAKLKESEQALRDVTETALEDAEARERASEIDARESVIAKETLVISRETCATLEAKAAVARSMHYCEMDAMTEKLQASEEARADMERLTTVDSEHVESDPDDADVSEEVLEAMRKTYGAFATDPAADRGYAQAISVMTAKVLAAEDALAAMTVQRDAIDQRVQTADNKAAYLDNRVHLLVSELAGKHEEFVVLATEATEAREEINTVKRDAVKEAKRMVDESDEIRARITVLEEELEVAREETSAAKRSALKATTDALAEAQRMITAHTTNLGDEFGHLLRMSMID